MSETTAEVIYETDRVRVIQGDALAALDILHKHDADLLCTDPPYGVNWQSSMRTQRFAKLTGDDGSLDVPAVLGAYTRKLLHRNKHVYVFGYRADQLKAPLRLGATAELVWDKGRAGMGDLSQPWGPAHEIITFGNYDDCDNATIKRGGLSARLRQGSVLRVPRLPSRGNVRHSTQKPVALMRQLVESSSRIGDVVLDPFAGSGSTLVAAVLLGRRAVGVEIDPHYASVAVERCKRAEEMWAEMSAA